MAELYVYLGQYASTVFDNLSLSLKSLSLKEGGSSPIKYRAY